MYRFRVTGAAGVADKIGYGASYVEGAALVHELARGNASIVLNNALTLGAGNYLTVSYLSPDFVVHDYRHSRPGDMGGCPPAAPSSATCCHLPCPGLHPAPPPAAMCLAQGCTQPCHLLPPAAT
jgi:hypothetical protein